MITQRQNEIAIGTMLGDGSICKNFINNGNGQLSLGQSKLDHIGDDKISYMEWFANEFYNLGGKIRFRKGGLDKFDDRIIKRQDGYEFTTSANKIWTEMEKEWYIPRFDHLYFKRRKIVPSIKLTPLTLCIWYMDDGSCNLKNSSSYFHTNGFIKDEVYFLIELLNKDLGIKSTAIKGKIENQFEIRIPTNQFSNFIEIIKPYINWSCFMILLLVY